MLPSRKNYANITRNFKKEQLNTFRRLQASIRSIDQLDPFLFGKPTERIALLLLKLYHENILRNQFILNPVKCMFGILETESGDLYCTISEDPLETDSFPDKYSHIISLLRSANIAVEYPDGDTEPPLISWRSEGNVVSIDTIPSKIKDLMFINSESNYDTRIWDPSYTVKFVNSNNYLADRRSGTAYPPFKKIEVNEKSGDMVESLECVNGSTCVEAKLFSYIYSLGLQFTHIKGFAAYWIGNQLPPKHYNQTYGYSLELQPSKLNKVTEYLQSVLDPSLLTYLRESYDNKFESVMTMCSMPIALPCPGCLANITLYTKDAKGYRSFNPNYCGKRISGGTRKKKRNQLTRRKRSRAKRHYA